MMYKEISKSVYKKFSNIEGNHGIASEYAIETILKLIKKYNVKSILELGLGIGYISDAILKYSKEKNLNINYIGTEANTYCLSVLNDNVEYFKDILKIIFHNTHAIICHYEDIMILFYCTRNFDFWWDIIVRVLN